MYDEFAPRIPAGHKPPEYRASGTPIILGALQHVLLRRSYDQISKRRGLLLTTDHLHLNDTSGQLLRDLLLDNLAAQGFTTVPS